MDTKTFYINVTLKANVYHVHIKNHWNYGSQLMSHSCFIHELQNNDCVNINISTYASSLYVLCSVIKIVVEHQSVFVFLTFNVDWTFLLLRFEYENTTNSLDTSLYHTVQAKRYHLSGCSEFILQLNVSLKQMRQIRFVLKKKFATSWFCCVIDIFDLVFLPYNTFDYVCD